MNIEQRISSLLIRNGVRPSLKGFTYLKDAVGIVFDDPIYRICEVYQTIADIHSDTPSRVERAIRHAKEVAMKGKKCTNGDYISQLAESLRYIQ